MRVLRVLALHRTPTLDKDDLERLHWSLRNIIGAGLDGVVITAVHEDDPTHDLAKALVAVMERAGELPKGSLERTETRTIGATSVPMVAAIVWAKNPGPWSSLRRRKAERERFKRV